MYLEGVKQMTLVYNEKFTVQGTGVLACKWRNCGREFTEKKYLVDHVTSSHIEQRKGCDDFPCFWEVISLFLVNIVNLTLTLIKLPKILSVFFFNLALTCAVTFNDYDADMSSSVETVQCEVQAAHPHASSHWREAVHLQGEYLLELECPSFIANKWQCYAWRLSNGFRGAAPHVGLSIEIWPQGFSCNLNAPPNELISVAKVTFSNQLLTLPSSPSP